MSRHQLEPTELEVMEILRARPVEFQRVRAAFGDENGISEAELDDHAARIVAVILKARRFADAEAKALA